MDCGRNNYSKTDPAATFMRMKDDHMRNGQLKPGYNVQIAVNSEYITGVDVFRNRTDFGTLAPFLKHLQKRQQDKYGRMAADAGYESLYNDLFLEPSGRISFIKPANYEVWKTKKLKKQIGRIENMRYDTDCFLCAQDRKLSLRRECTQLEGKQPVTTEWYRCEDCKGCPQRDACCKAKDSDAPKGVMLRKIFWEKRAESKANIPPVGNLPENVPFHSDRGDFCVAQNELRFPVFSDRRQRKCPNREVFSGYGI